MSSKGLFFIFQRGNIQKLLSRNFGSRAKKKPVLKFWNNFLQLFILNVLPFGRTHTHTYLSQTSIHTSRKI